MKPSTKKLLLSGTAAILFSLAGHAHAATTVVSSSSAINGGTGTDAPDAATIATPGVEFNPISPGIDVTNTGTVQGGAGFNVTAAGTTGTDGATGLDFNGDSGTSGNTTTFTNTAAASILGGHGGNGADGSGSAGGTGGNGGAGVSASASFGSLDTGNFSGMQVILGGTGGTGGAGDSGNDGGQGGNGGIGLNVTGTNFLSQVDHVYGGTGGNGGQGDGASIFGNGGAGGAGVSLGAASDTLTVYNLVQGGVGGTGADLTGSQIGGGSGGNGGAGIVTSSSGAQIAIDAGAGVIGGFGGAGGMGGGGNGLGGAGIDFDAGTTGASLNNFGSIFGGSNSAGISGDAIDITNGAAVDFITNDSSGSIGDGVAETGTALNINNGSSLGTLVNAGTITSVSGAAVSINDTSTLTTLENTGTITSGSTGGDANAAFVVNSSSQGSLTNDGVISNTGGGVALAFTTGTSGTFTNSATGQIKAVGGTAIDFSGDTTFVNEGSIQGDVKNDINTSPGNGNVTFTNSGTIAGNVTLDYPAFYGFETLTMSGGSITGDVTINGFFDSTLNLNGGQIIGDTIVQSSNGTGDEINVGGNYTTGGTITSNDAAINVASGVAFNVQNDVNVGSGVLTNAGSIELGAGSTLTVGTQTPGGSYIFDIASAASRGQLAVTAGNVTLTRTQTSVNVLGSPVLSGGTVLDIATGTAPAAVTAGKVSDNSALYDFNLESGTAIAGSPDDAYLLVSAADTATANGTGATNNERNAEIAINAIGTSSNDPDFNAVQLNLQNATTNREANRDLEKTEPTTDGGSVQAAVDTTDTLFNLTDQQLALSRTDDAMTGMAAGDSADGLRGWGQAFGGHASQGDRNGNAGYSANTAGGAFGADTQSLLGDSVLGLSFAYGHTHVDNNIDQDTQVNSYQATAYGSHYLTGIDKNLFVDGMASFQYGRNDETRNDVGGVAGLDASGHYNSYEGAGRAEVGRDFGLADLGGVTLTPTALTDYTLYHQESYSESGAGGADLHVGGNTENIWNVGLGGQATWLFKSENGSYFKPDIRVKYKYDLLNDNAVDVNSTFAAGGPSFSTNGLKQGRNTANAGFDLRFYSTSNWEFTGSYDFTWKQQYTDNTGLLRAAYKF